MSGQVEFVPTLLKSSAMGVLKYTILVPVYAKDVKTRGSDGMPP